MDPDGAEAASPARSGNSRRDVGDFFPQIGSSPFRTQSREESRQSPQLPRGLPRTTTPCGWRFPSLNEAHRNITGRSISNPMTTSQCASPANSTPCSESIGLQDLSSSRRSSGAHPDSMADKTHDFPVTQIPKFGMPRPPTATTSQPSASDSHYDKPNHPPPIRPLQTAFTGTAVSTLAKSPEASDNTVDRIYKQYQAVTPESDGSAALNGVQDTQEAHDESLETPEVHNTCPSRDGATNRCGFRPDELDQDPFRDSGELSCASSFQQMSRRISEWKWSESGGDPSRDFNPDWVFPTLETAGVAPAASLPLLPGSGEAAIDSPNMGPSVNPSEPSSTATPNTGILLNDIIDDQDDEEWSDVDMIANMAKLFPLPPQPPRNSDANSRFRYLSAGTTHGETTTESDDDPFKYDKASYTVFLQPSKEREVSAVLQHVSGLSSHNHSRATLCSPDDHAPPRPAFYPPMPIEGAGRFLSGSPAERHQNEQPQDSFYHTTAFGPPSEARRVVSVANQYGKLPVPDQVSSPANDQDVLNGQRANKSDFYKGPNKESALSEGGDWETVATSGAGYGSTGLNLPPPPFNSAYGIKVTGSSIADVSDVASSYGAAFEDFGSMDRIIQHPSNDSLRSYRVRNVKGSNIPIFVAKQRTHRVNGFAHDSCRLLPAKGNALGCGYSASSLRRKLSDPLGRLNSLRRRHRRSPKAYRKDDKKPKYKAHGSKDCDAENPWGFNQSFQAKGSLDVKASNIARDAVRGHFASQPGPVEPANDVSVSKLSFEATQNSDTTHGFSFDLIALPEAARKQAVRRASGLEDPTETGHVRGQRAMSRTSSKNSGPGSPAGPRLPKIPESAHHRRSEALLPGHSPPPSRPWYHGSHGGQAKSPRRGLGGQSHSLNSTATSASFQGMRPLDGSVSPSVRRKGQAGRVPRLGDTRTMGFPTPRLFSIDERRRGVHGTDPELRAIADLEAGLPLSPNAYMTYRALVRRRIWFVLMLLISIFPFMSILVFMGKFDNALSWYTQGEVDTLSDGQKRTIRVIMILQFVIWPFLLFFLIWQYRLPGTAVHEASLA